MSEIVVRPGESWLEAHVRTKYGERATVTEGREKPKPSVGPEFEFDDL